MRFKTKYIRFLALLSVLFLMMGLISACSRPDAAHHTVVLAGSTSVQPYAELLAEEFGIETGIPVDVQGGGSSAGITAAESGTADIGMSSRAIKDEEVAAGVNWQITICKDGLAIIVHPDNPIRNLTLEQIRKIYLQEYTRWEEVGNYTGDIHLISREAGSGTRDAFIEMVMEKQQISARAIIQDSNGAIRQIVSGDPRSIGFISMGLIDDTVAGVSIDGVEPISDNVFNGTYALYRPFIFCSSVEPTGNTKQFVDFVMSDAGQQILAKRGLIPIGGASQ